MDLSGKINGLSLFSGIGGLDLALDEWVRPIAYCEIDPYCQGVLLSRMADESLPNCPIWDDIKTLDGNIFQGAIDIIYGGFPCQNISIAGKGEGLAGEQSGLFFEIVRLAKEIKPKFIFLENVSAISRRGGLEVVKCIAEMGYDCKWCVISAASVGALHKRERWFLLAHSQSNGNRRELRNLSNPNEEKSESEKQHKDETEQSDDGCANVAYTRCECERSEKKPERPSIHFARCPRYWETEPAVGRMVDGVQHRTHRIKSLGNSVVPAQVKEAFKILMAIS